MGLKEEYQLKLREREASQAEYLLHTKIIQDNTNLLKSMIPVLSEITQHLRDPNLMERYNSVCKDLSELNTMDKNKVSQLLQDVFNLISDCEQEGMRLLND